MVSAGAMMALCVSSFATALVAMVRSRFYSTANLMASLELLKSIVPGQLVLRACNPVLRSVGALTLYHAGVVISVPEDPVEVFQRTALFVALVTDAGAVKASSLGSLTRCAAGG